MANGKYTKAELENLSINELQRISKDIDNKFKIIILMFLSYIYL
tara:strand:- start:30 stop:161 length:132 start_codon:yes stop_codon:yes gene_type:complete